MAKNDYCFMRYRDAIAAITKDSERRDQEKLNNLTRHLACPHEIDLIERRFRADQDREATRIYWGLV